MTHYKLVYFNARGRAELARLLFAYAGVEYEDFRCGFEEWPQYKPRMPFGQAPVLEVDGKLLAQSITIARYLATKFNLTGKDKWEAALADMYVDCISDLHIAFRPFYEEKDKAKKKELLADVTTNVIPHHLEMIEEHLSKNNTGHLVGNSLTWADLAYYYFFTNITRHAGKEFLEKAPRLSALNEKVGNIPAIKKWVETRPKTYW